FGKIFICINDSAAAGSSTFPAGYPLYFNTNAASSPTCGLVSVPGLSDGMSLLMRLKSELSAFPSHVLWNAGPASGGASLMPASESPWHDAHVERYVVSPRPAWASVNTLSHTDPGASGLRAGAVGAGVAATCIAVRSAVSAPVTPMTRFRQVAERASPR